MITRPELRVRMVSDELVERMIKPRWRLYVYLGLAILAGMLTVQWIAVIQSRPTVDPRTPEQVYEELYRRYR